MSRYHDPVGAEGEMQPGSHGRVLKNKLGIVKKSVMDRAEYEALVAAQQRYLIRISHDTQFDAGLICGMHRDWLGDLYEWAGQYRTVNLAKDGFAWPGAFRVSDNMERFSRKTLASHTPCRHTQISALCHSLAAVHAELLLIHPFREGNGRLARWLADLMVLQAGYPMPIYRFEGRGSRKVRSQYLCAVQQGYLGHYEPLAGFFAEALRLGMAMVESS